MTNKIKMNIDFYKETTEDEFLQAKETLMDDCGYSEESANLFLENLYSAVADEFGE